MASLKGDGQWHIEEIKTSIEEAEKAVDWLRNNIQMLRSSIRLQIEQNYNDGFYPINIYSSISCVPLFTIVLIHETYGPYEKDYMDKLDQANWATKLPNGNYEINTPHGKYLTCFEYYDNHSSGY